LTARRLAHLVAVPLVLGLAACATTTARARHFGPGTPEQTREALVAWQASADRASALPPARLMYDARVSSGGAPAVPGTLAVTYDGRTVVSASLTGPFGSRIAEYREGTVTGEDRRALVVDPEALRAVLAGTWDGQSPKVEGFDGAQALLGFEAEGAQVLLVLDVATHSPVSLDVEGRGGHLVVEYSGEPNPWPAHLTVREETTRRRLVLKLLAVEAAGTGSAGR
jgi:hypothetical protein